MIELKGIKTEEFAHPEAEKALRMLKKTKGVEKALSWLLEKNTQILLKNQIMGNCFGITETNMPWLYAIVKNVCRTLDYEPIPKVYLERNSSFDIKFYPGDPAVLIFPDYVLDEFDGEMLVFQTGRAVAALKNQACELLAAVFAAVNLSSVIPFLGDAAITVLVSWVRKECLTEDRGGLLACQNVDTAMRVLMREAGLPLNYMESNNAAVYIKNSKSVSRVSQAGQYARTVFRVRPWNNERMVWLYQWYQSGAYDDLLEEYEQE